MSFGQCNRNAAKSGNFAPWLDLHGDVKVESNPELLESVDEATFWPDEGSGLHLLGAGPDAAAVVVAPLPDLLPLQAEVVQAADEASRNLGLGANSTNCDSLSTLHCAPL